VDERPVALVTGASRGIGAATAVLLAERGYRLALVATTESELNETAQTIDRNDTLVLPGDLSDMSFVESAAKKTVSHFGRVDVLINNAAERELVSMRRITPESWNRTLAVCLTAPAFLSRWVAEDMQKRSEGVIINVSSMMSQQAAGIASAYIASKGGLDSLTYELASLYGPNGIRVLGLRLGAIETQMSNDLTKINSEVDEIRNFSEEMIMLRRWGQPNEIAQAIAFFASDSASYFTGTTVTLDGGWFRQHLPLNLKKQHYPEDYP